MRTIILTSFILLSLASFAQSPKEVTQQLLQKIQADVEKEAIKFRQSIPKGDMTAEGIGFAVDTFKLEHISAKRMEIDYSTAGMNTAVDELTNGYDKLLNKYYNKLLGILKPDDKKVLIAAQRAWLIFRDAEVKLIDTMAKDEYSGGGTMQSNIATGAYSDIVVKRTLQIFTYYDNVIKK